MEQQEQHVYRSSAEAEHRCMSHTICEMIWLKNLLLEFGFRHLDLILMFCDNQSAIYIAQNQEFYEKTKHTEADCHLVRDT